jgi:integrase
VRPHENPKEPVVYRIWGRSMNVRVSRLPSYRLHKPTGQAVVTIGGRDVYLGKHESPESRAEYDRIIAEWLATGRRPMVADSASAADLSVNEMHLAYLHHADSYYVKNGKPTTEPVNIRLALRPLRQLYGHTPAREFGPLRLKTVRQAFIDSGLCRSEVNKRVRHVLRAFKWAVGEEMVPPSVHHGLKAVPGLRRGRADVRESEPVRPVPDAFVDAIAPHVSRQVWTMIELQRLSGMRPGEVCSMRTIDVDRSGRIWIYTPESHKTEHHGRERRIYLGPKAQETLRPWLRPELTAYLFSPADAEAERRTEQRENRKTRVQPSQRNRRRRKPRKAPGERYTVDSYRRAIEYGIKGANREPERGENRAVPHWHPHQLRHNAATRLRREFGLDVARAVLGHSSPVVTEVYAELDGAKAAEAMERVG